MLVICQHNLTKHCHPEGSLLLVKHWLLSYLLRSQKDICYAEIPTVYKKDLNLPNGYLKVVAKVDHEMEETLGVVVEQILAPDSAMVGVELDQHLEKRIQTCHINSERLLDWKRFHSKTKVHCVLCCMLLKHIDLKHILHTKLTYFSFYFLTCPNRWNSL